MATVVFFRAVNVGGHQTFRPGALAKELAQWEAVNLGAAGTFVVRARISPSDLRREILSRLPFQPELMICPAPAVLALLRTDVFSDAPKEARSFVTVLREAPRHAPPLPVEQPANRKWEVRVLASSGRFVFSLWRRQGRAVVYPNAVIEKHFGIPGTTRNWNTILNVAKTLAR